MGMSGPDAHGKKRRHSTSRTRPWILTLLVIAAVLLACCLITVLRMALVPGGMLSFDFIPWAPTRPAQDADHQKSPVKASWWWKTPHPRFNELMARKPTFPKANVWQGMKAVACLRQAFVSEQPQDMRIYSQWGEDGILEAIFKCIGTTDKRFAEFGAEDGSECSTRWLREGHGFQGLLMDGSNENLDINLRKEMIYAENISAILHRHKVPYPTLDHMTIDIDLNTWHVTAAVMQGGWRPRSLTVEFNRNFLPHQAYTAVYWPNKSWENEDCYFGGSALAFVRLLGHYGYQLVAVDQFAINLFFVHDSALGWWPAQVHANTPKSKHPLYQVWPKLHTGCQRRTWVEVPDNIDFSVWDQSMGRRPVLFHKDRADTLRVFFEAQAGDSGDNLDQAVPHREDQAEAEFSRYKPGVYTLHSEPQINDFAARLRVPVYAGLRVAGLPDVPPKDFQPNDH